MVGDVLDSRIALIKQHQIHGTLKSIGHGLEKESLRVDLNGTPSLTPHPSALGSALTHSYITTDYSEALLEFITPVYNNIDEPVEFLANLHHFTYQHIGEEIMWVNSMPCTIKDELSIPIATYGKSNVGRMKHVYRHGLWHRYGRRMQTIAGIHYNLSFPNTFWQAYQKIEQDQRSLQDFISDHYFGLIRNFQRNLSLIIYLFGSSPAICKSFLPNGSHNLSELNSDTLYAPYGTSLRMSNLGYHNDAQASLNICYNSLDSYVESLDHAIKTSHGPYEKIGVVVNGQYHQLNSNILQIENEYYASIRPKRVIRSGERSTHALAKRGVEYIEMRCVDIDPFVPVGISKEQMRFLDMFALYCLVEESPHITPRERSCIQKNQHEMVFNGRTPQLKIHCGDTEILFQDWAHNILQKMEPIALLFDSAINTTDYSECLQLQQQKTSNPDMTPSARVLKILETGKQSFLEFGMGKAKEHRDFFLQDPQPEKDRERFQEQAIMSLQKQQEIEANDNMSFEDYLKNYFSTLNS